MPKENFVPELSKIARQAGFTEDSLRTCLRDQALMDKILTAAGAPPTSSASTPHRPSSSTASGWQADRIEDFDKAIEPLLKS